MNRRVINITAGEDIELSILITDSNGAVFPLTGFVFNNIITLPNLTETEKSFVCTLDTITTNKILLSMSHTDTIDLRAKRYLCDIQMISPDGVIRYHQDLKLTLEVQHNRLVGV